jgi:hypothetical protein
MGYTIGTGKDSRQDAGFTEQEVLARFVARQPEIMAYKRRHGGALEDAFRAVTGEPWPSGRSVKVHGDGRAELTKDRTTKSVLGKYVAPIAAGVAAPFLLPALAAGAGAGGAAAGIGETGAVTGLAGSGFGAGGGLGLTGAGAGFGGAGAGAAGLGAGAGAAGTAATTAGAGSGIFSALKRLAPLGAAAIPLAGMIGGGGSSSGGDLSSLMQSVPQLKDMLDLQVSQAKRNDPLHQAVTQMAMNLMPRSAMGPRPNRPKVV